MQTLIKVLPLLAIWLLACSNEVRTENQHATAPPPDGKSIYKINCVQCHGLYGNMGASGSFDLTVSTLSLEERIQVITNGRNTMLPFGSLLSEEKIKAVAEYTLTLKTTEE
ncbi:MAG: cytochrome c [Saprospiraceae bacterium]|nr:cytochrome c [Saprospiraceae bacterium]